MSAEKKQERRKDLQYYKNCIKIDLVTPNIQNKQNNTYKKEIFSNLLHEQKGLINT